MSVRVDWRQSVAFTGTVIKYLAVTMLVPLGIGLLYGEDIVAFLISIAITVTIGVALERLSRTHELGPREALLFVGLSWGAVAVIGAIPYVIAGYGTESALRQPVNALFESMSGFTTTGATVTEEISFARHSHALLMWRQLTQWLGGMGIIVLMVAILPEAAVNGAQLIESEAPGPELQKLTPKIAETARLLWLFYLGFTVLYVLILLGLHYTGYAPNMNAYNAVAHGFTTLPTGGFSPQAASIAAFSPAVQWVVIPFMLIAGMNFALFYLLLQDDYAAFLQDRELQAYLGANAGVAVVLWGLLFGVAAFGMAYFFLEPAIPGSGATKRLALAGAGFLTVSGAPWLVLPPQPPGVEQALGTEVRLTWYAGLMALGALVAVLAGFAYRRTERRHTAVRLGAAALPLALLVVPVALAPANPVHGDVPAALVAAYRWTVVFGQLLLWATIAGVHAWLGDSDTPAADGLDYPATAD